MKGFFITFEGVDHSGKSTHIKLLKKSLEDMGYEVVMAREPGGTEISEKIREIVLDGRNSGMFPVTEALLFAAARAQLVHEVIEPALQAGKIVLCDRFLDSSIAYQGYGRELGEQAVLAINECAVDGIKPNLTFVFFISREQAERRNKKADDRMERQSADFFQRVEEGFTRIACRESRIRIDASRTVEKNAEQILEKTLEKIGT